MLFFSQGARFAVSRGRIHQRPREEYMDLLAEVSGSADPCANYMNEWLWYYIMGRPQAAPCEAADINMEAPVSMASRFLSGVSGTDAPTTTTAAATTTAAVTTAANTTAAATTAAASDATTTAAASTTKTVETSEALSRFGLGALAMSVATVFATQ